MIEANHPTLSIHQQCNLLDLHPSAYYYQPKPIDLEEERLMNLLDKHYTEYPFEGKIKRSRYLTEQVGYVVGVRRIRTLMAKMGLKTVYPKPNTSVANKAHKVYPYLLRDVDILYPNQVWAADITYLPLQNQHVYLFAIIDWFSRYVIEWCVSPSLETDDYVATLIKALSHSHCDIFNTDQGSQFTSKDWIEALTEEGVSISMDGRGCYYDNIFVERLWRTVKQECIYLHEFKTIENIRLTLNDYFQYYNHRRVHQGLGYHTPAQIYSGNEERRKTN